MTEWNIETALNHHAACSVYDDGACTCGLRDVSHGHRSQRCNQRVEVLEPNMTDQPLPEGTGLAILVEKLLKERDLANKQLTALRWQIENEGCAASHLGETTYECRADAPCGLCRLRSERDGAREHIARMQEIIDSVALIVGQRGDDPGDLDGFEVLRLHARALADACATAEVQRDQALETAYIVPALPINEEHERIVRRPGKKARRGTGCSKRKSVRGFTSTDQKR